MNEERHKVFLKEKKEEREKLAMWKEENRRKNLAKMAESKRKKRATRGGFTLSETEKKELVSEPDRSHLPKRGEGGSS